MNARDKVDAIQKLLENKHDLYVRECKNGPTWGARHRRLDGWGLQRSWKNLAADGYEIKVSRPDLMSDDKWHDYLPMCNRLWFVCPSGIIQPEEMPAELGLMWASKNYKRLYKKKMAAYRSDAVDIDTLWYILICRAAIHKEDPRDESAYWKAWMAKKAENRWLGAIVSKTIREHVMAVERENDLLRRQITGVQNIKETCTTLGVDTTGSYWPSEMCSMLREARDGMDIYQRRGLEGAVKIIQQLLKQPEADCEYCGQGRDADDNYCGICGKFVDKEAKAR